MTLSYTPRFHLAVPDFQSEPWHAEFAAAMESIDQAMFTAIVATGTSLWENDHSYLIGDIVIDPATGTLYASAQVHTSSSSILAPTFEAERIAFPTRWTSFAVTAASQAEAELGDDNSKYMTPLRTKQAIFAQSPTPGVASEAQATEGVNNTEIMTPLRSKQAVTARIATQLQAEAGADNTVLMTPLRVSQQLEATGVSGGAQIAFSAHKNGVDQTGIASGVATKITFGTELYDLESRYDTANSRWTPPAGAIHITGTVRVLSGLTIGGNSLLIVYKNGAPFKQETFVASTAVGTCSVSVDDTANGTDYYELFFNGATASTISIQGNSANSFFMGHFLGEVGVVTLGAGQIGFRAHKNSVAQNIPNATYTKVTFGFEDFDQGSHFDTVLSRWTPPTGLVHIDASLYFTSGVSANSYTACNLHKNGVSYRQSFLTTPGTSGGAQISIDDSASGTDYYEIFAYVPSGGVAALDGNPINTYFGGHFLGGSRGAQGDIGPAGPSGSIAAPAINCGRLRLVSTTQLSFTPFNGDRIKIDGVLHQIPAAGISGLFNTGAFVNGVPASALAANTLYYVYAFVNSGVVTADFSTTNHAASTAVGNEGTEIRIGDNSRTLIGMIRTSGVLFADSVTQRLVANWFNRRTLHVKTANIAQYVGANVWVDLAGVRVHFLTWGDESAVSVAGYFSGYPYESAGSGYAGYSLDNVSGNTSTSLKGFTLGTNQQQWWVPLGFGDVQDVAEGYHYIAPMCLGSPTWWFQGSIAATVRG